MERLDHLDEENTQRWREHCQRLYPTKEEPCPGSNLKTYDDVLWLGWAPMRVIWGHQEDRQCNCYCPDVFGETSVTIDSDWIFDRAPVTEGEEPLPIWPEEPAARTAQQQQQQPQAKAEATKRELTTAEEKRQVRAALASIAPELRQAAKKKIAAMRKGVVDDD